MPDAFADELVRLRPQALRFATTMAGNVDAAEDLVSDAIVRALTARESFVPGSNMRAWLFTIVRNLFITGRRRARFTGGYVDDLAPEMLPWTAPAQEARLHLGDGLKVLARLPSEQVDAVVLVALGECYDGAAANLGINVGTLKSRVCRGRQALEEEYDRAPGGDTLHAVIGKRRTKLPSARPGTPLYALCDLVAQHRISGAARALQIDVNAVSDALRTRHLAPRLKTALRQYGERLAA